MPRAAHERIPKKGHSRVAYTPPAKKQRKSQHSRADRAQHSCPAAFLGFPTPERVDCSIPSHAANHPLSTEHLPYLPAADCGCPPCRAFPASLRSFHRFLRAEVPMSAFVCLRCLLPSRFCSFGSPYTAIYLYAAILASATNTATGGGSGERQQTSAASVGILCHILYHDKRLGTARR